MKKNAEDKAIEKQPGKKFSLKKIPLGVAHKTPVQLLRYIAVGTAGFWVDVGILALCVEALAMNELVGATIAFLVGLAVNYVLGRLWIFHAPRYDRRWVELLLFLGIGLIALGLNNGIIYLFQNVFAPARLLGTSLPPDKYYLAGKLVSMVATFTWNFFARKAILYRD